MFDSCYSSKRNCFEHAVLFIIKPEACCCLLPLNLVVPLKGLLNLGAATTLRLASIEENISSAMNDQTQQLFGERLLQA